LYEEKKHEQNLESSPPQKSSNGRKGVTNRHARREYASNAVKYAYDSKLHWM